MSAIDARRNAGGAADAAPDPPDRGDAHAHRFALLGNPNTGKTTLFNRLTGLRHKTSNFPGTTLDARIGRVRARDDADDQPHDVQLIDLPGVYSLELPQLESDICRQTLRGLAAPTGERLAPPDGVCIVVDATNLPRNLLLVGEALRHGLPTVIAVNMIDLARRRGLTVDPGRLAEALGCDAVACCARTGEGVDALRSALTRGGRRSALPAPPAQDHDALRRWADGVAARAVTAGGAQLDHLAHDRLTDRIDRVLMHPVAGVAAFALVMAALFFSIFTLATYPMDWIDAIFTHVGGAVESALPPGAIRDLLAHGVVGGVGATLVFLPQICLLFFLISLLEDTGYLARAAFVMDRVLRPFGLPGHSFVPLLSSHACALPGIIAARAVPDPRERLATILVAPFMTCSARLPVYVLLTTLLFRDRPLFAALAFVGCYALGAGAGVVSALAARRTILRGRSRPMALELPSYKVPSLRTALLTTYDRGVMFLKSAGGNILAICVALWWLSSYPHVAPPPEAAALRQQAAHTQAPDEAAPLLEQADRLERSHAARMSYAGRLGRFIQPVFAPLGYDWQLSVGLVTSFAAREVFVSTMSIVTTGEEDSKGVVQQIATAKRDNGVTPIFTRAACWSLLVYYVLAMQCLPTLAVTAREAGGAKWALLQLVWMSGMAYVAALIVYQSLRASGVA